MYTSEKTLSVEPQFEQRFIDAISRDLRLCGSIPAQRVPLNSLYLGGGTPSLLSVKGLEHLKSLLDHYYEGLGTKTCEWTLEANPETLSEDKLRAFKTLGINRLSVGVQSFSEVQLKRLERLATREHLHKSLSAVSNTFENFSVDLMIGIPEQTFDLLKSDLEELMKYDPPHISVYLLTLSDDHKWLHHPAMKDRMVEAEVAADFYEFVCRYLKERGYRHYEVSNFSKPGFESRHNSMYWTGRDSYMGLGPGAHGFLVGDGAVQRYEVERDWHKWLLGESISWIETLSAEQRELEDFYFRLRTRQPIKIPKEAGAIQELMNEGLAERREASEVVLTDRGWLMMESVAARLVPRG